MQDSLDRGVSMGTRAMSAALILASLIGPELFEEHGGRARYAAIFALLVFVVAAFRARTRLRELGELTTMAILFVLAALIALAEVRTAADGGAQRIALSLPPILAGWTAVFALLPAFPFATPGADAAPARASAARTLFAPAPVVAVLLSFTLIAITHALVMPIGTIYIDEGYYRLTSNWLSMPGLVWKVPQDLVPFFLVRHAGIADGGMFTQYPPGWPAVLAAFRGVGLEWWSGAIISAVTVWLSYLLAVRVTDRDTARVAAVLLAISPWFQQVMSGYMAHILTIPCGVGAALLLIDAERSSAKSLALRAMGAGALLGLCFAARPFTGILIGLSIVAWRIARAPWTRTTTMALVWTVVGGIIPAVLTFWFNAKTTGHPFIFGYRAIHGVFHDLGFGQRGFIEYDVNGKPVQVTWPYTPFMATVNFSRFLRVLTNEFLPIGLLLPLVWLARAMRFRFRWQYVAGFLVYPAVHCLYWFSHARLESELLPFLLIGASVLLVYIARVAPGLGRALVLTSVVGTVLFDLSAVAPESGIRTPWRDAGYVYDHRMISLFRTADQLRREHHRVLFFVDEAKDNIFVPGLSRLWSLNTRGFDGDVLVARDRGAADTLLVRRFPDRTPIRLVWDNIAGTTRVEMLPKAGAGGL